MSFTVFRIIGLAALVLTANVTAIHAQPSAVLYGVVSDQTGASVPGARVDVIDDPTTPHGAMANRDGRYRIDGLRPGEHAIRVSAPGFQTTERRVTVAASGSTAADFQLVLQTLSANVLVTADDSLTVPSTARATADVQRAPGAVEVVSDAQFKTGPAATIKDVLGWVPGLTLQPKSNIDARVSIRGSGLTRNYGNRGVNMYMDGIPINTADGLFDLFEIDPTAYRYVEVFKGANALRYGANALGGAVNFVTPTGRDTSRWEGRLDVGSFGSVKGQASTGGVSGRLDYFVTGSAQREDGYREHSNGRMERVSANVGYQFSSDAETRVYVNANTWRQRLPGEVTKAAALSSPEAADSEFVRQDQQRNIDSVRIADKTTLRLGTTAVEVGLFGVRRHVDHPIYRYLDYRVNDYGAFARTTTDRRIGGFHNRLIAGVNVHDGTIDYQEYENLTGAVKGALLFSTRDRSRNESAYVENSFFVAPHVALVAGGQFLHAVRDRQDRLLSDGDQSGRRTFDLFDPKVGVVWDVDPRSQIFGNISRSAEVPSFDVNSFASPASTDIDAQTATTWEVGTRAHRPDITWDVSVYRARLRNELQCLTTSPYSPCTVVNADRTVHQGLEAGLGIAVLASSFTQDDRVWLNATYTYSDFFFENDARFGNNELPGVGPHSVRAEVLYRHPSGFYAGPNVEWMPKAFFADNANSLTVDPFALLNVRAGYDRRAGWSAYLEGRNLLDRRYISTTITAGTATPTSALFNPGTGRAIFGGTRFDW
jgi:iron complex outermembrane receptor protein